MTAHDEIRALLDAYLAAGNAADPDTLLSCYADDVIVHEHASLSLDPATAEPITQR